MTTTGFDDIDQVHHLADAALSVAREILDTEFWKILPDDLLMLGRQLEALSRTIHAAQLHLTGEIDTRGMAGLRSCSSTHALLRQALNISNADAIGRVKAARQILNRETLTSDELPPLLPVLAHAVDNGELGAEHIRTIVETMDKIPVAARAAAIAACEKALVETGVACDPNFLERAATRILERVDPDGDLDDRTADARCALTSADATSGPDLLRSKGTSTITASKLSRKRSMRSPHHSRPPMAVPIPERRATGARQLSSRRCADTSMPAPDPARVAKSHT